MTLQQDYTLQDGKYRILKVLGQGGFGITYLAIQVRLDRKVAIKEFFMKDFCERNETTSQVALGTAGSREKVNSCRKKFLKEAKHIALLNHPNIIRIIDVFDENSTSYYVMEYIEGGSLENKLGTTGLSMSDATRYILQVAETLKYIHKKNIAHLDIKPSNIMLNGNDEILLIDFGVSKQYDFSTGEQTSVFPVAFSSGYTPLEQYAPDGVEKFSPKSDIYSLGATYFKLLTGITPLKASEITKDFLQENLKAKGVPTAVISIICKSMEKLQENRFSDVSSFIEELNSISLQVADSSDKKDENIAYKQNEEGTAVMPSQEEIDIWVKNVISGEYNTGRYERAFEYFSEYAKMGNATAQYYLGKMYYEGQCVGGSRNYAIAAEWYRKSAEQGNAEAQHSLGSMYENGEGVSKDLDKAVEWYRKAAEKGASEAQYRLGEMYEQGRGISQDYAKALEWYRKSAEQGNVCAQCNLGKLYYYKFKCDDKFKCYAEAVGWFRKAAEQGDVTAQCQLAYMYYLGEGVSQDYVKAVEWYRKAAEQRASEAQYRLGEMYEQGRGISQDYAKALEWYRKSAEQGNAKAQCQLGCMYRYGSGVSQDYAKTVELYLKSAEQGNADAQRYLGEMYELGFGVSQDYAKATEWYRKAAERYRKSAEQGDAEAQYNLGKMYEEGSGVSKDSTKAMEWYQKSVEQGNAKAVGWYLKSAEQGNATAQCQLGNMYIDGSGVSKDRTKAVEWYRKSAEQGNATAQYRLGNMYKNGIGVSRDDAKAAEWYRKSAEQGYVCAQRDLGLKYFRGKSYKDAFYWFNKAATQGDCTAQKKLGDMYFNGYGLDIDYNKAFFWYNIAANQHFDSAMMMLGHMYYHGCGINKDYSKALFWYSKMILPPKEVLLNMAYIYEFGGYGVIPSIDKAAKYRRKSVDAFNFVI